MPKIILKINSLEDNIYEGGDICAYVAADSLSADYVRKLVGQGAMVLCSGKNADILCRESGAAGILAEISSDAPVKAQINKIRERLGKGKFLGVVIPARRHEAMLASETEPEFVAFKFSPAEAGAAFEVIKWYNELFLIQSAIDLESGLQDIVGTDADFVIINSHDYEDFGC